MIHISIWTYETKRFRMIPCPFIIFFKKRQFFYLYWFYFPFTLFVGQVQDNLATSLNQTYTPNKRYYLWNLLRIIYIQCIQVYRQQVSFAETIIKVCLNSLIYRGPTCRYGSPSRSRCATSGCPSRRRATP